jgi:hypothetical protein
MWCGHEGGLGRGGCGHARGEGRVVSKSGKLYLVTVILRYSIHEILHNLGLEWELVAIHHHSFTRS